MPDFVDLAVAQSYINLFYVIAFYYLVSKFYDCKIWNDLCDGLFDVKLWSFYRLHVPKITKMWNVYNVWAIHHTLCAVIPCMLCKQEWSVASNTSVFRLFQCEEKCISFFFWTNLYQILLKYNDENTFNLYNSFYLI